MRIRKLTINTPSAAIFGKIAKSNVVDKHIETLFFFAFLGFFHYFPVLVLSFRTLTFHVVVHSDWPANDEHLGFVEGPAVVEDQ